jgi:hypothetical protein
LICCSRLFFLLFRLFSFFLFSISAQWLLQAPRQDVFRTLRLWSRDAEGLATAHVDFRFNCQTAKVCTSRLGDIGRVVEPRYTHSARHNNRGTGRQQHQGTAVEQSDRWQSRCQDSSVKVRPSTALIVTGYRRLQDGTPLDKLRKPTSTHTAATTTEGTGPHQQQEPQQHPDGQGLQQCAWDRSVKVRR